MVTEEQKHILRHTLGIDNLRWYKAYKLDQDFYRNHFVTTKDTDDCKLIHGLIENGLMAEHRKEMFGESVFYVTEKGIEIAKDSAREQIKKNKPNRSKARYQCYLHSESSESFFEWLKNGYWNEYRKRYQV